MINKNGKNEAVDTLKSQSGECVTPERTENITKAFMESDFTGKKTRGEISKFKNLFLIFEIFFSCFGLHFAVRSKTKDSAVHTESLFVWMVCESLSHKCLNYMHAKALRIVYHFHA